MARHKNQHHEEEIPEAWLLPYSDLMTLLLALFIVLFATSKVDQEKTKEMAASFRSIFGGGESIIDGANIGGSSLIDGYISVTEKRELEQSKLESMFADGDYKQLAATEDALETYFYHEGLSEMVETHIDERGLVVSLNNSMFFDSGSAKIMPDALDIFIKIGDTIKDLDNYIRIEGHTDNIPIRTVTFPSNWELSSARASEVIRLFVTEIGIPPEKMVAVGYGEFRPLADNDTAENRAKNRRVDIILLNTKYDTLENQLGAMDEAEAPSD